MKKKIEKIRFKIRRNQIIVFSAGTILFLLGLLRYVLVPGRWGINIKTQLPTIVSGAEFMILGALLIFSGIWTYRNKEKVIQFELDEIKENLEKRSSVKRRLRKRK